MQAAFWSHHVTTVNILRSSSGLASADTCLLLCSLLLINIHVGFFDTIVSCFCSYPSHTSAECPPLLSPWVCPRCALSLSNLPCFLEMILKEESSSSVQLSSLPWAPDLYLQLEMSSQRASRIPIQVLSPPSTLFSLPLGFIWLFKIISLASALLTVTGL